MKWRALAYVCDLTIAAFIGYRWGFDEGQRQLILALEDKWRQGFAGISDPQKEGQHDVFGA